MSRDDHRYVTALHWQGSTALGYDNYSREHRVRPAGKSELTMSADPTFRGDAAITNPEELLLAAASSCQLLSFLAVAARARADVYSYVDHAEAVMSVDQNPLWVNEIRLSPVIEINGEKQPQKWERWLRIAHQECFIARSLRSRMTIAATFLTEDGARTQVVITDD